MLANRCLRISVMHILHFHCTASNPHVQRTPVHSWNVVNADIMPTIVTVLVCALCITPIVSKIFESIVMKWVDHILEDKIDDKQFGGGIGTSTTDALVEMIHHWCEATDRYGTYVRIVLLDFAKAFDLINHEKLLVKHQANDVPPHILRWMASFRSNTSTALNILGSC